jgi:hypothetical protein
VWKSKREIRRVGEREKAAGGSRLREECRQSCCHFSNGRAAAFRGPGCPLSPRIYLLLVHLRRLFQQRLSFLFALGEIVCLVLCHAAIYLILSLVNDEGESRVRGESKGDGKAPRVSLTIPPREINDAFLSFAQTGGAVSA